MASDSEKLVSLLGDLYARCRPPASDAALFADHASPAFIAAHVRTFQWYRRYLPARGRVLDWGCRHAPDACLIRATFGDAHEIHGCDLPPAGSFAAFHEFAGLQYRQLADPVRLPYDDGKVDAILASGALEHVERDRELLRELRRCLAPGGPLIITFLPNRWSREEFFNRLRGRPHHEHRYGRRQFAEMLRQAGFEPVEIGYQSRSAALRGIGGGAIRAAVVRTLQLHRLTSCLCAVARRVP